MGYRLNLKEGNKLITQLLTRYKVFAPKRFVGGATFSDMDCIRYGEISSMDEIEFHIKSEYSFKEAILPVSETLFYYTEEDTMVPKAKYEKAVVFLRSCDIHALKRLDTMYLQNGGEDYYYKRLRENVIFILMGCEASFDHCFCVDMGSNQTEEYHGYIHPVEQGYEMLSKEKELTDLLEALGKKEEVSIKYVTKTKTNVTLPQVLPQEIINSDFWNEYTQRCIGCGRCNFVCPTCSCFTMQDVQYKENEQVGERRRVWASCQVDGFSDMAGGHSFRKTQGERMRYKVLHKIKDYKERNGYHMCVGCGRCDFTCPEYISFSNCINKLAKLEE